MLQFHTTVDRVLAVRISPDGRRLAVASGPEDKWTQLSVWDLKTAIRMNHHQLPQHVVAISDDWSLIAIRNWNSFLTILDTETLQPRFQPVRLRFRFDRAFFQPNSTRIITIGHASYAPFQGFRIAYDFEEGTEYVGEWDDFLGDIFACSRDGRIVAVYTRDAIDVREWE